MPDFSDDRSNWWVEGISELLDVVAFRCALSAAEDAQFGAWLQVQVVNEVFNAASC